MTTNLSRLVTRSIWTAAALLAVSSLPQALAADPHPDDVAVVRKIAERVGLKGEPEVNPRQGWPNLRGQSSLRFRTDRVVLLVGFNEDGRATSLTGNGPLLPNESFTLLAELPELESIRIDHNTPKGHSDAALEDFDGSGIAALKNSKLASLRIGHAFDDDGMQALAQVPSLRSIQMVHSRVTDAGVAHLARHPNIEDFTISSQARSNRVTNGSLKTFATLPKLKRLAVQETFLTFEEGLKHLSPLKGRLELLSLKSSLVLPSDLEKFKADHPTLEIETSTPAEILASPNSRGVERWASPEAIEYLKSGRSQ